jgi:cellulose synthase/poly-beta-1,6-N-acetylglucosamine synthase-like glycosyltransferase
MISIVIPSYNSERTIAKTLKSLLNQDYEGKYEIIVVDSSTDKTPEIVSKFPVKLIRQKPKGPAAARNLGVRKAKGEIVVFIDSDCIAPRNWLRNLLKPFSDKTIVAVSGTYRTKNKESIIARFAGYEIEHRHERMKKLETIDFVGGFNCAYRKDVFLKFGGFDTKFIQSEDGELSYKIAKKGHKIKFNPSAYVYHYHPDSLTKFLKQKFWHAYWRVLVYKKHKDKMFGDSYTSKFLFVEEALIGITFWLLLLSLIGITSWYYGLFSLAISFLITIPTSLKIFLRDKIVGILSPIIIILRDFVTGLGIVYGIISLRKTK